MDFSIKKCPHCGKIEELMFSNNPIVEPVCFSCINDNLDYNNIEHAEFFCRSYNLPMNPQMWMNLAKTCGENTFKFYAKAFFEDTTYSNLYYDESTKDVWSLINKEWEKCRTQHQVISRLEEIKESYIERASQKWGQQFSFDELVSLDSTYNQVIKSCNITNAIVKESLKVLCIIQIQMRQAIMADDSKTLKDLSSSFSAIAKTAGLDEMIEQTKTDDITTVSELYQYFEDKGFEFKFYDNQIKDEVDFCIQDIKDTLRQTVLDSTGVAGLLEQMIKRQEIQQEQNAAEAAAGKLSVEDLLDLEASELLQPIEEEEDSVLTDFDFSEEA